MYLPKDWAADADRRKAAGVPEDVAFATKIVLARRMVDRAVAAGVPAGWVAADAVYGSDHHFRAALEGHGLGYAVAVRADFAARVGLRRVRAKALLAGVPAGGWTRPSSGTGRRGRGGTTGCRCRRTPPSRKRGAGGCCSGGASPTRRTWPTSRPAGTPLAAFVRVGGSRWAIEECSELAEGECGLDEYEVRSWAGWHRHVTPSVLALVAAIRARPAAPATKKAERLVPASVPEVRKRLLKLAWAALPEADRVLPWSEWRR